MAFTQHSAVEEPNGEDWPHIGQYYDLQSFYFLYVSDITSRTPVLATLLASRTKPRTTERTNSTMATGGNHSRSRRRRRFRGTSRPSDPPAQEGFKNFPLGIEDEQARLEVCGPMDAEIAEQQLNQ